MPLIRGKQILTTTGTVVGTASAPTSTNASFVQIPQMTLALITHGAPVFVFFNGCFNMQNGDNWDLAIYVDGSLNAASQQHQQFFGGSLLGLVPANMPGCTVNAMALVTGLSAGSHTFEARWSVAAGTARTVGVQRTLTAFEFI
jgi:hypothetical protein